VWPSLTIRPVSSGGSSRSTNPPMMKIIVCLLSSFAICSAAVEPIEPYDFVQSGRKSRYPSPDGRFELLITYAEGEQVSDRIELIEKATERVVADLSDSEINSYDVRLLWSADSTRVAALLGARRGGHTRIFIRTDDKFQEVALPKLPEIPDTPSEATKKKYDWEFARFVTVLDVSPVRWLKSGGLELSMSTELSGTSGLLGWYGTVAISINAKHEAKIQRFDLRETFEKR
jgi:hypothetical protein